MSILQHYRLGSFFPPSAVFGGYVIILSGILALVLTGSLLSLLFMLAGTLISFTMRGCLLDAERKKILLYTSFLGIRKGRWQTISQHGSLRIEKHRQSYGTYSWGNRYRIFSRRIFVLMLIQEEPVKSIPIGIFEDEAEALNSMKKLSTIINYEIHHQG